MAALTLESSVDTAIDCFLEHLTEQCNYSPQTLAAYRTDLQQLSRYLYPRVADPRVPVRAVQRETVAAFAAELKARGLKPASVARKLAAVRSLFHYLCREHAVAANPARYAAETAPPRARPVSLRLEQIERALALVPDAGFQGTRDRAILEVLYGSGIQLSEVVGLNLSAVELERGTVRVSGRTHRERVVPVGRAAQKALRAYLQRRAELLVGLEITSIEAGALFLNRRGRRLTRRSVQRVVQGYLAAAAAAGTGCPDKAHSKGGPQVLRNTYAAHMMEAGADQAAVRQLLGHAALPVTPVPGSPSLEQIRAEYDKAHPRAGR